MRGLERVNVTSMIRLGKLKLSDGHVSSRLNAACMAGVMRSRVLGVIPFGLSLLLPVAASAQPWSGILSPSRAIDWTQAGLQAIFSDGETTPNPWTPPTRMQSGSTVTCANTSADATTINNALAAAKPGSFVLLGTTTCDITSNINMISGVTLRGSGPQNTFLNLTGTNTSVAWGTCCGGINSGPLSASSYASGTTSVTISGATCSTSCTSNNLVVGNTAWIQQCDTGYSGSGTAPGDPTQPNCSVGGHPSDNLGLFVCGIDWSQCSSNSSNNDTHNYYERQTVTITGVTNTGGGSYTVTFAPGLYLSNWSSGNNAILFWTPVSSKTFGAGLEDMTVNFTNGSNQQLNPSSSTADWWIKGVRAIGGTNVPNISISSSVHGLLFNNYIVGQNYNQLTNSNQETILRSQDSDNLLLNNIVTGTQTFWANGLSQGDVIAYNYGRDAQTGYYANESVDHNPFSAFKLEEGNQMGYGNDDDTHGTHGLNTWFRNYYSGWDPPYVTENSQAFSLGNYHRFDNFIGNALGGTLSTAYQGTSSSLGNEFVIYNTDALSGVSFMRWGNCDVTNAGCRFVSSEVPTSTVLPSGAYPNSAAYQNSVPVSHNLPCSFFMGSSTGPCSVLSSGGTGLSWWKVCKAWGTFPTSCSATQTQPFPPIGPDESGGPYVSGYAYDIPASIAYTNLPIDSSLQASYTITASSWSNNASTCATHTSTGTAPCEILTVTMSNTVNSGSANHIMGGFQLSGVNAACVPSGLPANNEILMTGSTYVNSSTITIVYSLASNPGVGCTGSMLFPDIRQFDERVYMNDSLHITGASPPTNLSAIAE